MGKKKQRGVAVEDAADILSEHHTITAGSIGDSSLWDEDTTLTDNNDEDITLDALLIHGCDNNTATASRRLQHLSDSLQLLVNIGSENRTAVREKILRHAFLHISHTGRAWTVIVPILSEISNACRSSFQRGAPAEQYAACRVMEVISILLGANEEEFCESLSYLQKKHTAKEMAVQKAAMRTYATAMLICADIDLRMAALDWFESMIAMTDSADHEDSSISNLPLVLKATAWDCWSLLCTLLPDDDIAGEHNGRGCLLLDEVIVALDCDCLELRSAAGQAATLLHEARLSNGNDHGNVTTRQFEPGSWEGSAYEDAINEIQQKVASLAVENTRMARKTKKAQRATFREFAAMLVDDEPPDEAIHFRNGSLEITSWKDLIVLNHLRSVLQGGFQTQLLTNPTIQRMLQVDAAWIVAHISTDEEKRKVSSKNSLAVKAADQERRGKRDKRENIKNHFLTADDD